MCLFICASVNQYMYILKKKTKEIYITHTPKFNTFKYKEKLTTFVVFVHHTLESTLWLYCRGIRYTSKEEKGSIPNIYQHKTKSRFEKSNRLRGWMWFWSFKCWQKK